MQQLNERPLAWLVKTKFGETEVFLKKSRAELLARRVAGIVIPLFAKQQ